MGAVPLRLEGSREHVSGSLPSDADAVLSQELTASDGNSVKTLPDPRYLKSRLTGTVPSSTRRAACSSLGPRVPKLLDGTDEPVPLVDDHGMGPPRPVPQLHQS